jgi:anti-anti-sigma factor
MEGVPGTVMISSSGGPLRATLSGEFDLATAPNAERDILAALQSADQPDLTIDLTEVTFMDSTMLHVLVRLHRSIKHRQGTMVIESGPQPAKLLELAGLDNLRITH